MEQKIDDDLKQGEAHAYQRHSLHHFYTTLSEPTALGSNTTLNPVVYSLDSDLWYSLLSMAFVSFRLVLSQSISVYLCLSLCLSLLSSVARAV